MCLTDSAFREFSGVKGLKSGVRAPLCAHCVYICSLCWMSFETDSPHYERDASYFFDRDVEGRIILVVGYGCEASLVLAWHKTFHENALLTCSDDVAFIPLQELSVV